MDTFRVLVKVCDINAFIRANGLCADVVAHSLFLAVDLREGPVHVPLPVNFIAVNLPEGRVGVGGEREREVRK